MSPNGFSAFILRLTRYVAGRDRQDWVLAMVRETEAAGCEDSKWALGCLYAAAADSLARNAWFVMAILALSVLATIVSGASAPLIVLGAQTIGISMMAALPLMLAGLLPAGWLLGRMRPNHSPVILGSIAFVIQQIVPLMAMWVMIGRLPAFWTPNVVYYDVPPVIGLLAGWLTWMAATWWGGTTQRAFINENAAL